MDLDKNKFERAMKWGCTECINPKDHDKSIVVRILTALWSVQVLAAAACLEHVVPDIMVRYWHQ